jgi:pyruvate carboxylase subunit A
MDSGVYMGYTIPPFYDSMIAKLSTWGSDREEAISRMKRALYEFVILGVTTNIPFHKAVLDNEAFVRGDLTTHFIDDYNIIEDVKKVVEHDREKGATLASVLNSDSRKVAAAGVAVGAYVNAAKKQMNDQQTK